MTSKIENTVSRETVERLRQYETLVKKWNPTINLVSKRDLEDVWSRHIVDSLQVPQLVNSYTKWVDIGSGGGFPGVVVAICALGSLPEAQHVFIESDLRKSTFLRTAIRELSLNAEVITARIEEVEPQNADVLSARALASLDVLCSFAQRHLARGGLAVFPKGRTAGDEIREAQKNWNFSCEKVASETDAEASILLLKDIARV